MKITIDFGDDFKIPVNCFCCHFEKWHGNPYCAITQKEVTREHTYNKRADNCPFAKAQEHGWSTQNHTAPQRRRRDDIRDPYFTDTEHRILLSAMGREENLCKRVKKDGYEAVGGIDLVEACGSIERKIYRLQHPEMFPDVYDPCTGTGQIFSPD